MKEIPDNKADVVDFPPLNETQRKLRGILEYWGPDGKRHAIGDIGRDEGPRCAVGAALHLYSGVWADLIPALQKGANDLGYPHLNGILACNNSGFDNARKMVLRAIELAK